MAALRESANVRAACVAAGVVRSTAYKWREEDADFAAEWDAALEDACDLLESTAWQRAHESSDTLLIFLLKAHRPEKYRETVKQEHSGSVTLPVEYVNDWRRARASTAGGGEDA